MCLFQAPIQKDLCSVGRSGGGNLCNFGVSLSFRPVFEQWGGWDPAAPQSY